MSDIIIKAENLGKKYMIGHQADKGGIYTKGYNHRDVTYGAELNQA